MKKLLLLLFTSAVLMGCKKDSSSSSSRSGIKIKYEIISSTNITSSDVSYSNETGATNSTNNAGIGFTTWTKEITYTNALRPYQIGLIALLYSNSAGSATANIYINGKKEASVTVDYEQTSYLYRAQVNAIYNLQ